MSTSIDEAVDAFLAALAPLAGTAGVTGIYEDRTQAYTQGDAPAINVTLTEASADVLGDQHPARSTLRTTLQLDLAIYTRSAIDAAGREASSRKQAGDLWQQAHALLMADPSLGGKALRLRWRRSSWRKEAADGAAGWAVHTYELTLAMREQSLAAP